MHLLFLLLPAASGWVAVGQVPAGAELTEEQREALDECRTIILESLPDSKSRRLTAERLLKLDFPARIDLAIELLSPGGAPVAICEAIATVGTKQPAQLDPRLVDPLLNLLGDEHSDLSARASAALSAFRDGDVADRLGALASDDTKPLRARVAAVEALALNTHRKEVVAVLVDLIEQPDKTVLARVLEALRQTSRTDYGNDIRRWKSWWNRKSQLTDEVWLRDRLDLAVVHNQELRARISELASRSSSRRKLSAKRIGELLRQVYQLTPSNQREATLMGWLSDGMAEYRLYALRVVRERVAEGDRPSDEVRDAVKDRFTDSSAAVRTAALDIVGALRDPSDAEAVLDLLSRERDASVRESVLRVMGRLDNLSVIGALVGILKDANAAEGCVREAANAIGVLGDQGHVKTAEMAPAIEPLRTRFAEAPVEDVRLRESLLGAMAMIGDPAFKPEFVANLRSESPELLLAAIRGAEIVEAVDQLDVLVEHLNHADPRVRQLAAKAVGTLGSDESHLTGLITRLKPNVEDNEGVRAAAWDGFRAILSRHFRNPPSKVLGLVSRLESLPDRQVMLLEEMISDWTARGGAPVEVLTSARKKLASLLLGEGKYAEAVPYLRQLWEDQVASGDSGASDTRLDLVRACLLSARQPVIEIIIDVASPMGDGDNSDIGRVVLDHLESRLDGGDPAELRALVSRFQSKIPEGLLGPDWESQLAEFAARIPSEDE